MGGGRISLNEVEAQQNGWLQSHAMVAKDEVFFVALATAAGNLLIYHSLISLHCHGVWHPPYRTSMATGSRHWLVGRRLQQPSVSYHGLLILAACMDI